MLQRRRLGARHRNVAGTVAKPIDFTLFSMVCSWHGGVGVWQGGPCGEGADLAPLYGHVTSAKPEQIQLTIEYLRPTRGRRPLTLGPCRPPAPLPPV